MAAIAALGPQCFREIAFLRKYASAAQGNFFVFCAAVSSRAAEGKSTRRVSPVCESPPLHLPPPNSARCQTYGAVVSLLLSSCDTSMLYNQMIVKDGHSTAVLLCWVLQCGSAFPKEIVYQAPPRTNTSPEVVIHVPKQPHRFSTCQKLNPIWWFGNADE